MKPWTLKIRFVGRAGPKEYITGDVREDPGWGDEAFSNKIEQIDFKLPTGHVIHLQGYEQYNFFAECSEPLGRGPARIEAFYLTGKNGAVVDIWRIGDGTVTRDRKPWGQEWGGGPTRGWKAGLLCEQAKVFILRT
jgi:hypothetical protein